MLSRGTAEKLNIFLICFVLLMAWYSNIIPGIAVGTKILTPNGLVSIEDLLVGDRVTGYDLNTHEYSSLPIKDISFYLLHDFLIIETDKGTITTSQDQIFYDVFQEKFIPAIAVKNDSVFITYDHEKCVCNNMTRGSSWTIFYDITLDEPHIFFSSEAKIITHNFVPAATALYPLTEWILGNVIVIACGYLGQPYKYFTDFEQAKKQVLQEEIAYANRYKDFVNQQPPLIMGIQPNPTVYNVVMQNQLLYGPICALAQMQNDGDIEIVLKIFGFSHESESSNVFTSTDLAVQTVKRDHELVRFFIDIEDKKQLNELRHFVRTWSSSMVSRLFSCDILAETKSELFCLYNNITKKIIYERPFDVYAMYHMVEKNIPPSLVVQTIKYGQSASTYSWKHVIFSDQRYNIAILINLVSGAIIDVGYYGDTFAHLKLEEKKPVETQVEDEDTSEIEDAEEASEVEEGSGTKTIEDILEECEPGKKSDSTEQYSKPGGFDKANEDFDDLQPSNVQDRGNGLRTGDLPDGRTVAVRPTSSNSLGDGSFPTLEIRDKNKKEKTIKIRYT